MDCSSFPIPTPDPTLERCINLVRDVSYWALTHDFPNVAAAIPKIQRLEQYNAPDNWWRTWYRRDSSNTVDATAFFQRMKHRGGIYSLCLGFDTALLDPDGPDSEYDQFLNDLSGNGVNDGQLRYFILECLRQREVYIVQLPNHLPYGDPVYDRRRNRLLDAAKRIYHPSQNHPQWMLLYSGPINHRHWGNVTGDLWKLKSR